MSLHTILVMRPTRGIRMLMGGVALVAAGCAEPNVRPSMSLLPPTRPLIYADTDWAAVLQNHVREGLVDYSSLLANREPLERYYALIGQTGPTATPDQFSTRAATTAYWINAYNALVLRAVLERYPVSTLYDLAMPRLEFDYTFRVDRRIMNLTEVEHHLLADSAQDARALLATSRAAMGTPRLTSEPFRADTLENQLARAAADALDNPNLLRIDHVSKSILVWQEILDHEQDFVDYWRLRRRVRSAYLYNVILDLSSIHRRRGLQSAVGYQFREIPFERRLNDWSRPGVQAAP